MPVKYKGSSGGGSSKKIGQLMIMNDDRDQIEQEDGTVWLKCGIVAFPEDYPEAVKIPYTLTKEINTYPLNNVTSPRGIAFDDTHLWVIGYNFSKVVRYNLDFTTSTFEFGINVSGYETSICYNPDNDSLAILTTGERLYEYSKDGTLLKQQYLSQIGTSYALAYNDGFYYIMDNNENLHKINPDLTYNQLETNIATSSFNGCMGMYYLNGERYLVNYSDKTIHRNTGTNQSYAGFGFHNTNSAPWDLGFKDGKMYFIDVNEQNLVEVKYTFEVSGTPTAYTIGSNDRPYYMRVK